MSTIADKDLVDPLDPADTKPNLRAKLISKSIELCNDTHYAHQLNYVFCASAALVYQLNFGRRM